MGDPRPPTLPLLPDEMAELTGLMRSMGWPVVSEAAAGA